MRHVELLVPPVCRLALHIPLAIPGPSEYNISHGRPSPTAFHARATSAQLVNWANKAKMASEYCFKVTIRNAPFDDVLARTREALAEQGFGVPTEMNTQVRMGGRQPVGLWSHGRHRSEKGLSVHSQAIFKSKLQKDTERRIILGACQPHTALEALQIEPDIAVRAGSGAAPHSVPPVPAELAALRCRRCCCPATWSCASCRPTASSAGARWWPSLHRRCLASPRCETQPCTSQWSRG